MENAFVPPDAADPAVARPEDGSAASLDVRAERSDRWVRGWLGDVAVVDSREPLLVWSSALPVPAYAFAPSAFTPGVLSECSAPDHIHPFYGPQSRVAQWYAVSAGGRVVPAVAWRLTDLPDQVVVSWEPGVLDRWTEEDEEVGVHPRDPYKRIDALASSRQIRVLLDGQLLAESRRPVALFETRLPTRWYLPADDVRLDLLTRSETVTRCPYKGETSNYWSFGRHADIAWCYGDPIAAAGAIARRIAFYDEAVDVEIDGVRQTRPNTFFGRGDDPDS